VPEATSAPRQARGPLPDGYTLTLAAAGFMAVNPSVYAKLPYDSVKDFAPVSLLVKAPLLLVANSTLPSRNAQGTDRFRARQPGQAEHRQRRHRDRAASGRRVLHQRRGHFSDVHIPYKGSAPATNDLLAWRVSRAVRQHGDADPACEVGQAAAACGVVGSSASRFCRTCPRWPSPVCPGFETGTWYGVVAPAATPAPDRRQAQP
jgi:tripartite-type tricarboxylate transporter receptor subunit TctC